MQRLVALYKRWKGQEPLLTEKLMGAGSNRAYYRMSDADGGTVIGVVGTSRDEKDAFIYLTKQSNKRQLPEQQLLAVAADESRY